MLASGLFGLLEPVGLVPEPLREWRAILRGDPCSYCGRPFEAYDHILARRIGGEDVWQNLTSACRSCNSSKRDRSLLLFLTRTPRVGERRAGAPSIPSGRSAIGLTYAERVEQWRRELASRPPMVVRPNEHGKPRSLWLHRKHGFTRMDRRVAGALLRTCRTTARGFLVEMTPAELAEMVGRPTRGRAHAVVQSIERLTQKAVTVDPFERYGVLTLFEREDAGPERLVVWVNPTLLEALGFPLTRALRTHLPETEHQGVRREFEPASVAADRALRLRNTKRRQAQQAMPRPKVSASRLPESTAPRPT